MHGTTEIGWMQIKMFNVPSREMPPLFTIRTSTNTDGCIFFSFPFWWRFFVNGDFTWKYLWHALHRFKIYKTRLKFAHTHTHSPWVGCECIESHCFLVNRPSVDSLVRINGWIKYENVASRWPQWQCMYEQHTSLIIIIISIVVIIRTPGF